MIRRLVPSALALALVLAPAACASRTVFRYRPSERIGGPPILPDGVAVADLADARGRRAVNHNLKFAALIPLVPFAVSHRDYPERTWFDSTPNLNGFDPARDLADALAAEIDAQGIFSVCRRAASGTHGERYELRGRLEDCHVVEGYLTYGLSFLSVVPHLVGFPEGTLRCEIRMRLEVVDRRDRSTLWSGVVTDRSTRATWIYDSEEGDLACAAFSRISSRIVREAAVDLRRAAALRATAVQPSARLETSSSRPR